ncbi:hypothetical protein AQPE_4642 [Aquipluma nitroreducens]|uniref:Uncharacterized protein n=1 Tax=Aquipluma nitroreducens TaxID=2010828 RepID=A0A5K7SFS0_9BACT|nr:hypothetical protein [Aquipluma nitroreducens]BBE20450.1 hypothetical protein AQPE_4642 [Aquipluma nitroreducens]
MAKKESVPNLKVKNDQGKWVKFKIWIYERSDSLNILILVFFYIIIIITIFYGIYGIVLNAKKYGIDEFGNESSVLVFSEKIFLFVLPLFIVLGFFNYYYKTIRSNFDGTVKEEKEEDTMQLLNNSKIIFLTSVLSYVIIKTIEQIFIKQEVNMIKLLSYGLLILILMGFIIVQHKINHGGNK